MVASFVTFEVLGASCGFEASLFETGAGDDASDPLGAPIAVGLGEHLDAPVHALPIAATAAGVSGHETTSFPPLPMKG
tara:strand:+ start:7941 stop:8174 length:234 start_codon:yes stop_codon:yes gene_type:complete